MRAFVARRRDIDRCPIRSLAPAHYHDDGTCRCRRPDPGDLYAVARVVTDEVCGAGAYADTNAGHPDPRVRAQVDLSRRIASEGTT